MHGYTAESAGPGPHARIYSYSRSCLERAFKGQFPPPAGYGSRRETAQNNGDVPSTVSKVPEMFLFSGNRGDRRAEMGSAHPLSPLRKPLFRQCTVTWPCEAGQDGQRGPRENGTSKLRRRRASGIPSGKESKESVSTACMESMCMTGEGKHKNRAVNVGSGKGRRQSSGEGHAGVLIDLIDYRDTAFPEVARVGRGRIR